MKKKMAFVDLSDFRKWPTGGMLCYEQQILEILTIYYEIDLWGVSVDGKETFPVRIGERDYPVHVFADAHTSRRMIPNYWRGMALVCARKYFQKYDIIYVHTGSCAAAAAAFRKKEHQLLVYHQHGLQYMEDYSLKTLLQRPFMFMAQKRADFTFVVTGRQELEQYILNRRGKLRHKLVQICSPIATSAEAGEHRSCRRNGNTFIYAGRFAAIKRVPLLIEAFYLFCKAHTEAVRLIVAGDGEEYSKVKKKIIRLGLENKVLLTGCVTQKTVQDYLQQSDFYVTASAGEGFSVAVLEAFAAGIPVVCFPVRGLAEQVKDGITGEVAKGNSPEALMQAMERIYRTGSAKRESCVNESKKYAKEIIGRQIVDEMERRYENQCDHSRL